MIPKRGPGNNTRYAYFPRASSAGDISCMLMMVIENPIHVTIVRAVPLCATSAEFATIVENCGESAVTAMPQRMIITKKIISDVLINNGESKQQVAEISKAYNATFLLPVNFDNKPP